MKDCAVCAFKDEDCTTKCLNVEVVEKVSRKLKLSLEFFFFFFKIKKLVFYEIKDTRIFIYIQCR